MIRIALALLASSAALVSAALQFNEILTSDATGKPDWVELHNPEPTPFLLTGYFLTDDKAAPKKWPFPEVTVEAQKFLLVYASGFTTAPAGEVHAPFKLSSDAGYLALVDPAGKVVEELTYPKQKAGFSYGYAGLQRRFFNPPTPNAANGEGVEDFAADTKFSVNRGYYDKPLDVVITCETPNSDVFYTIDGSDPRSSATSKPYSTPVHIEKTTVLRAAAKRSGWESSNTDTQTYIFLADIIKQPKAPEGFPAKWKTTTADYAMDPRVTDVNPDKMQPAFRALGAVSFVGHVDDFFGTNGIYSNTTQHGIKWEKPVSMEWIKPDGGTEFQVNCGLRVQGGYFRDPAVTQKHSLRVLFKDIYGPGKLRHDIFKVPGAAKEFDGLVLRAGANDGYAWDAAVNTEQFTRDEFGRRLQLATGNPGSHGTFVHVYLNGLYWGMYNLCERPNEDLSSTYYGGDPEDWDSINAGDVKNIGGKLNGKDPANNGKTYWNLYIAQAKAVKTYADYVKLQGLNPDGSKNPEYKVYFDPKHYMDYILTNVWGGNWDWPNKNFWFGRLNTPESNGFRFYVWDFENTMGNNRARSPLSMKVPRDNNQEWVWQPHSALNKHIWYQVDYADRVQRHMFNEGVLTPEKLRASYKQLTDFVEPAIYAESARWGDDYKTGTQPPQTIIHWQKERDWLMNEYLPKRTDVVIGQLKTQKLYPASLSAPILNKHGGSVAPAFEVSFTGNTQNLYYTTDGTPPTTWHPETGAMMESPKAKKYEGPFPINQTTLVKARYFTPGDSATFTYSAMTEATFVIGASDIVISEIMYHPKPPTEAEVAAGYNNASDFEYITLMNTGATEADLSGLHFDDGISFDFTNAINKKLAAGAKAIVAQDLAAFKMRYGTGLPVIGQFKDKLDDKGERLRLVDAAGTVLHDFSYDNLAPWPTAADGQGKALVLQQPATKPSHADATKWAAGDPVSGTPAAPALGLAKWLADNGLSKAEEDSDGDGLANLLEFALGTNPKASTGETLSLGQTGNQLTLRFPRRADFAGVVLTVESSTDMKTWSPAKNFVPHETTSAGEGKEWVTLRGSNAGQAFLRLKAAAP